MTNFMINTNDFLQLLQILKLSTREGVYLTPHPKEISEIIGVSSTGTVIGSYSARINGVLSTPIFISSDYLNVIVGMWGAVLKNWGKYCKERDMDDTHVLTVSLIEGDMLRMIETKESHPAGLNPQNLELPVQLGDEKGVVETIFQVLNQTVTPYVWGEGEGFKFTPQDLTVLTSVSKKLCNTDIEFTRNKETKQFLVTISDWEGVVF